MTRLLKGIFGVFRGSEERRSSDFSDFFEKTSAEKAKVIRQVLREANEEQRKVIREYKKASTR